MRIAAYLTAILLLVGCQGGDKPNIEFIQDMMESPAIKAQELDGGAGMRLPPEHTVPVGFRPYKYAADFAGASRDLKNPFANDASSEVLLVGMKMYDVHCAVCHGLKGEGGANRSVSEFMALKPPSLISEKAIGLSDGHLYHIITAGQGLMGAYANHVPQKDRWQLVTYIRSLQKEKKE